MSLSLWLLPQHKAALMSLDEDRLLQIPIGIFSISVSTSKPKPVLCFVGGYTNISRSSWPSWINLERHTGQKYITHNNRQQRTGSKSASGFEAHLYRPQTKLREGYVFTGVCDSVNGGGGLGIPSCLAPPLCKQLHCWWVSVGEETAYR